MFLHGWHVLIVSLKCADPYLNTDAGTMSPFEHGEVFVLDDGGEVYECDQVIIVCMLAHICSFDAISSSAVPGGLGSWKL